jgi:hypothetical protein
VNLVEGPSVDLVVGVGALVAVAAVLVLLIMRRRR